MTYKIKSFFLTSAKLENFNKVAAWIFFIGCSLLLIGNISIAFLFPKFAPSFTVFEEYNVPVINFIFRDLYRIIAFLSIFAIYGIIIFLGLLKKKKWGYWNFLFFNTFVILLNLSFMYFGNLLNRDVLYIAELIKFLPEETESLLFSLNLSYYFQGIFLSLIHAWLIWRYWQRDMKVFFGIKKNC